MEKKKHSIKNLLIWVILAVFVISGVLQGSLFGSSNNPVLARVGGQTIRYYDVRKYAQLVPLPEGVDRNDMRVLQAALNILIRNALITQECKRLRFVVSDAKVVEVIKKQPQFLVDGRFSRAKFLEELAKLGISEMEYKSIQKEALLHRQWLFMVQNAYIVPQNAAQVVANAYAQKRTGRYVVIDRSRIKVPKLNAAQLEKFYKDNISLFAVPEHRVYKILGFKDSKYNPKLNSLLDRQKFDAAASKFENVAIMSDASKESLNALVPDDVLRAFDSVPLKVGENTRLYAIGEKIYAAKLMKIVASYTPELSQIKDAVVKEYDKQYRLKQAQPNGGWMRIYDVKFGENYLGIPEVVFQAMFLNAVGKVARYDRGDETYFVVVDRIVPAVANKQQVKAAQNYLQMAILNDVVSASLESLRLRTKITMMA